VEPCFMPSSPWALPMTFGSGERYIANVSLAEARAIAVGLDRRAMAQREKAVATWDRKWAIAVACVRNKHLDRFDDVPERPQLHLPARRGSYSPEEIERLLSVCNKAKLPEVNGATPGQWWAALITAIVKTGMRPSEAIEEAELPPWPSGETNLHDTFRRLCHLAGIRGGNGLRGLRLAKMDCANVSAETAIDNADVAITERYCDLPPCRKVVAK
jgi:hypothetical protein